MQLLQTSLFPWKHERENAGHGGYTEEWIGRRGGKNRYSLNETGGQKQEQMRKKPEEGFAKFTQ